MSIPLDNNIRAHMLTRFTSKGAGTILTLFFLGCVIWLLDFEQAWAMYRGLSLSAVCLAAVSYLIGLCLRAVRFKWLLNRISKTLLMRRIFMLD